MKKIELSHRMYDIHDFQRIYDSKEVVPQPKYQRRRTPWPLNAKTGLIDTIVNNYPIPPIYIHTFVDDNRRRKTEIIDGQQRISTIMEFLRGDFALGSTFSDQDLVGCTFADLPPELQDTIKDYELSCMAIRGATDSDIIAIFSKMNSFSLPLNDQEKRNAIYVGEFKTTVYSMASKYYSFWRSFDIISDANIARMKDAELVSEIFSVINSGIKGITKKAIAKIYTDFEDKFPDKLKYEKIFTQITSYIGTLFDDNDDIGSYFRKVTWFFPLFLIFYTKSYGDLGSQIMSPRISPNLSNINNGLSAFVDKYKRGVLADDIRLLFQQGSKSPSKIEQRLGNLLAAIDESQ